MFLPSIGVILYLILLSPYGMGIPGFGVFNSLDLPKIGMIIAFVFSLRNNAIRVNSWHKFVFNILVLFHLFSAIFCMHLSGFRDFLFIMMFGYVGGYLGTVLTDTEKISTVFNRILWISVVLSISEFLLQLNFLDGLRNVYLMSDEARFNSDLGRIRLGMKASMGQYASTLPFAYNTFMIYVFLRLEKINNLSILLRILTFVALCFTLSRAVIILFILFELMLAINSLKRVLFVMFMGIGISYSISQSALASKYVSNYFLTIADKNGDDGLADRLGNNTGDLAVLDGVSFFSGMGPGSLESMKRGLSSKIHLDTSDSGILVYTLIDRGILSVSFLLFLYVRLLVYFVKSRFRDYFLLVPMMSLILLSISYRYEVLFLNFFFLMYFNERVAISVNNNSDL